MSLSQKQMEGEEPLAQARQALSYVLGQIHDRPEVGWYLGIGTQTFALLTEAFATIAGKDLADVIDRFNCPNAADPRKSLPDVRQDEEDEYLPNTTEIHEAISGMAVAERLELLDTLQECYCLNCGCIAPVKPCYCSPAARTERAFSFSR